MSHRIDRLYVKLHAFILLSIIIFYEWSDYDRNDLYKID